VWHARENQNDLLDVPEEVRRDLEIVLVEHVDEVLFTALHAHPEPEPSRPEPAPVRNV
jgi:ATP-dependent Lon protease